jgi:hypothetical protein
MVQHLASLAGAHPHLHTLLLGLLCAWQAAPARPSPSHISTIVSAFATLPSFLPPSLSPFPPLPPPADERLIISFAPNTLAYTILKRIGELFPGPSKVRVSRSPLRMVCGGCLPLHSVHPSQSVKCAWGSDT